MNRARVFWVLVALLLATMGAVQVTTALQESQTYDEGMHLAAGYSYLKTGDYRINPEHPPLAKILSALPLLLLKPHVPLEDPSWQVNDEREFGTAFLYKNRIPAESMLFLGRCMMILLSLCLGLALALWTRRRFGVPAALLALFLLAFDPNIIAHGRYIHTDLPMTLFMFLSCTAWGAFLSSRRWGALLWAGTALALTVVTKFSGLVLGPLFIVLYLIKWWQEKGQPPARKLSLWRLAVSLLVVSGISLVVIGLSYARETKRLMLAGEISRLRAHSYLAGLESVAQHDQGGHFSYLLGQRSEKGGWWYYFPVAFAVKTPTAVLILLLLSLSITAGGLFCWPPRALYRKFRQLPFDWYLLAVPMLGYFLLCMQSNINIGLRHILPIYPFLFILLAAILFSSGLGRFRRVCRVVVGALILLEAVESAAIFPHYLAFFNFPSGGPAHGAEYLLDSNIDWGQDLKRLKTWWDAHGHPPLCLAYFGRADPVYYQIPVEGVPWGWDLEYRTKLDCIVAISVTVLRDVYVPVGTYAWLRELQPIDRVGYSIYLYDLRKRPSVP